MFRVAFSAAEAEGGDPVQITEMYDALILHTCGDRIHDALCVEAACHRVTAVAPPFTILVDYTDMTSASAAAASPLCIAGLETTARQLGMSLPNSTPLPMGDGSHYSQQRGEVVAPMTTLLLHVQPPTLSNDELYEWILRKMGVVLSFERLNESEAHVTLRHSDVVENVTEDERASQTLNLGSRKMAFGSALRKVHPDNIGEEVPEAQALSTALLALLQAHTSSGGAHAAHLDRAGNIIIPKSS